MAFTSPTLSRPLESPHSPTRSSISFRSIAIGSLLVFGINALTPFNEYIVNNTAMVGSHLPVVVTLSMLFLVLLINAPLYRFLPAQALSTGELAIIVLMMLVSCSVPTQGLMRALLPSLVAPFQIGKGDKAFSDAFLAMNLPEWLYPVGPLAEGGSSAIVTDFYSRVLPGDPIPYSAWVVPLLGWLAFFSGVIATFVSFAWIIRTQWGENERLAFPLAQLQLALIEPPEPGRALNSLFRNRGFWIAFWTTAVILSINALNAYSQRYWPLIPLGYDLRTVLTEPPLNLLNEDVKAATLYLSFAAVTFFIQAKTAFSIWSIFLIIRLTTMGATFNNYELPPGAFQDQHLGGSVIFVAGMIFVARHHLGMVFRHLVAGRNATERNAGVPSYRVPAVTFVTGIGIMLGWLMLLQVQWWVAIAIVFFVLLPHLVTSRVVAETGLPVFRSTLLPMQLFSNLPVNWLSTRDVFFAGTMGINGGAFNATQSSMSLTTHGLRVVDGAHARPRARSLAAVIVWTFVLAISVAAFFSLRNYYTYATTLESLGSATENRHMTEERIPAEVVSPVKQRAEGRYAQKNWSPATQFGVGAGICAVLQIGAWRFAAWPFLPVGFVIATGTLIGWAWFSIFVGWLLKLLVLKVGGSRLFEQTKPVMIGIIFGEAFAASIWLVTSLVLVEMNIPYKTIRMLPN